jgi:hypothetical protein
MTGYVGGPDELRDVKLGLAEGMDSEALQQVALDIDAAADAWEAEQNEHIRRHEEWLHERNGLLGRLEAAEKALAVCKPVGAEFCDYCWHNPPHDEGCPIAALAGKDVPDEKRPSEREKR